MVYGPEADLFRNPAMLDDIACNGAARLKVLSCRAAHVGGELERRRYLPRHGSGTLLNASLRHIRSIAGTVHGFRVKIFRF